MSLAVVLIILALANIELAKAAPSLNLTEISRTDRNVESNTEAGTENVLAVWTEDESTPKIDISGKPDNSEQPAVEKPPDAVSSVTTEKLNSNSDQEGSSTSDTVSNDAKASAKNEISSQQLDSQPEPASDTNSLKTIKNDADSKLKSSEVESSSSDFEESEYLNFDSSIPDFLNSDSSNPDPPSPYLSKPDTSKVGSSKIDYSNPDPLNTASFIRDISKSSSTEPYKPDIPKADSLNLDSSMLETSNTDPSKLNSVKADPSKATNPDISKSTKPDFLISNSSVPESLKTDSANPDLSNDLSNPDSLNSDSSNSDSSKLESSGKDASKFSNPDLFKPDSPNSVFSITDASEFSSPDLSNTDSLNPKPLKSEFLSPDSSNLVSSKTDAPELPQNLDFSSPDQNSDKSDRSDNCDCEDSFGTPDTCECPKTPKKSGITRILLKSDSIDNSDSPVEPNKSNELENSTLDKLVTKDEKNSDDAVSPGCGLDENPNTSASYDAGQNESFDDDPEILALGEADFLQSSTGPSFPLPPFGVFSWIPPPFMTFAPIFTQPPFKSGHKQLFSPSFPPMPFDLGFPPLTGLGFPPISGLGFPPISGLGFPPSTALGFPSLPSGPYVSDASIASGLSPLNSPIFSQFLIDVGLPLTPSFEDSEYGEERLFACCF